MIAELIVSGIFILATAVWAKWKKLGQTSFPMELPQPKREEVSPSPHQHLRRQQQALNRQRKDNADWENKLAHATQLFELDVKNLEVKNSIHDLNQLGLSLQDRENTLKSGLRQLENEKKELRIDKKTHKVEKNKDRLESEKKLLKLMQLSLSQKAKENSLQEQQNKVSHGARMNQIRGEELNAKEKELLRLYNVKSFQLETILQKILHQFKDLELEKKQFSFFKERSNLDTYHVQLKNMQQHIDQMFKVKNEWLKIHRKEDNIRYKEEQLKLRQTYDSTQNKIKQLGIEREEINQHWDRRELDFRRRTLKFIGKNW